MLSEIPAREEGGNRRTAEAREVAEPIPNRVRLFSVFRASGGLQVVLSTQLKRAPRVYQLVPKGVQVPEEGV
jgi:hypothetical protein